MASNLGLRFSNPKLFPSFCCRLNTTNLIKISPKSHDFSARRTITFASIVLTAQPFFKPDLEPAISLDLGFTVPDLTPEEAQAVVRIHAQELLQIKDLIDMESWREVQKSLRESSGYLRQDLYTIIQSKPGNERPQLRKLYSKLFNSVTGLDYAARSKSVAQVQECFQSILLTLDDIFSRI